MTKMIKTNVNSQSAVDKFPAVLMKNHQVAGQSFRGVLPLQNAETESPFNAKMRRP